MTGVARTGDGLSLSGILDSRSVPDLRRKLLEALDAPQAEIRLDLSRVVTIDATALALLVSVHRRAMAAGGRLVLDGVGPSVARMLAVTRLNRVLDVRRHPGAATGTGGARPADPAQARNPGDARGAVDALRPPAA